MFFRGIGFAFLTMGCLTVTPAVGQSTVYETKYTFFVGNFPAGYKPSTGKDAKPYQCALTAFKLKDTDGLVTCLHGVLLPSIIAWNTEKTFDDLHLVTVDVKRDLAIISSAKLEAYLKTAEGFEEYPKVKKNKDNEDELQLDGVRELTAIGFPEGHSFSPQRKPQPVGRQDLRDLNEVAGDDARGDILKRGSPSTSTKVISLSGLLIPGLSGAPIVNELNQLLGVGSGRDPGDSVKGTTKAIGWAIPIPLNPKDKSKWKPITDADTAETLADLRKLGVPPSFTAAITNRKEIDRLNKEFVKRSELRNYAKNGKLEEAVQSLEELLNSESTATQARIESLSEINGQMLARLATLENRVKALEDQLSRSSAGGVTSTFKLRVPSCAIVYFDGERTWQCGTCRSYVIENLRPGVEYTYSITMICGVGDCAYKKTKTVSFRGGDAVVVDLLWP